MEPLVKSIRPFLGAKDFHKSRNFYQDLGFEETILNSGFSVFKKKETSFYLQDCYIRDWIDNTMIFLEVEDVDTYWKWLLELNLPAKYDEVKLTATKVYDWGKECFIHDPSGILWHFGEFNKE